MLPKRAVPSPNSRLSRHERYLMLMYRCLTTEEQARIDDALAFEWTAKRAPDDEAAHSARWSQALIDLRLGRDTSGGMTAFANRGHQLRGRGSAAGAAAASRPRHVLAFPAPAVVAHVEAKSTGGEDVNT